MATYLVQEQAVIFCAETCESVKTKSKNRWEYLVQEQAGISCRNRREYLEQEIAGHR